MLRFVMPYMRVLSGYNETRATQSFDQEEFRKFREARAKTAGDQALASIQESPLQEGAPDPGPLNGMRVFSQTFSVSGLLSYYCTIKLNSIRTSLLRAEQPRTALELSWPRSSGWRKPARTQRGGGGAEEGEGKVACSGGEGEGRVESSGR